MWGELGSMRFIIGEEGSVLPKDQIQAYLETEYRCLELELVLRIGKTNSELANLYYEWSSTSAGYITACNPFSEKMSQQDNAERQTQLRQMLVDEGYMLWHGEGAHPSNNWEPEPSYLVAGMSLDATSRIGRRWEQNAIVWCDEKAVPWLVLLR